MHAAVRRPRLFAVALSLCSLTASAASISGTVTNASNAPLAGIQGRAWLQGTKGYSIAASFTTTGTGTYTLNGLAAGTYKLDARMAPGVGGNYGDRWYDQTAPSSNGYVAADADQIVLAASDALTGHDFQLEILGGFDGRVLFGGTPVANALVRAERSGEPRIHHNDVTQGAGFGGTHWGRYYMRGMVPATDYRFIVHDPSGLRETLVALGPYTATSNVNALVPDFTLQSITPDTNEPNNAFAADGGVDSSLFRQTPPAPYSSQGAWVGPAGAADTDWYCFDALAGDRFFVSAQTSVEVQDGGTRENPFVDPVVALFDSAGTKLKEDDDSATDARGARMDTGVISADGRYCAVVSTYGDTAFTGATQGSSGRYQVTIAMGNRPPTLSASIGGTAVPRPPATVSMAEGTSIAIDLAFSDPDGDALVPTVAHTDNGSAAVPPGSLTVGAGVASYTWAADQVAATGSPYTIRFSVADGEFTQMVEVIVAVTGVNVPPTTPVLVAPADQTSVATATPTLLLQNSTDEDGDALTYEFELYYGEASAPAQTASVAADAGGQTSWTPAAIPENTRARWRARAFDGQIDAPYSPFTAEWTFLVDVQNDPPAAPVFLKPEEGAVWLTRSPALSTDDAADPEGDAVQVVFQLATNSGFTEGLIESPPVAVDDLAATTIWTTAAQLPWGSTWFARAFATDDRGGVSAMSNVHRFTIKANAAPPQPQLGEPFAAECAELALEGTTLQRVVVAVPQDAEGESVSIDLAIVPADQPDTASPLFSETRAAAPGESQVSFDTSAVSFGQNARYLVRARSFDGTDRSEWSECTLRVGDPGASVKAGCGCGSAGAAAPVLLALAALALLRRRRPRESC